MFKLYNLNDKRLWGTLWKAFAKSWKIAAAGRPLSRFKNKPSVRRRNAVRYD